MDSKNPLDNELVRQIRATGRFTPAGVVDGKRAPEESEIQFKVSAEVLSALLRGLPLPGETGRPPIPNALFVSNLLIVGPLDLSDAGIGDDGRPVPVALQYCRFVGNTAIDDGGRPLPDIDLSNARLGRLSLKGSRFRQLLAKNATIEGAVDISDVASNESAQRPCTGCARGEGENKRPQPRCQVEFSGSRIAGGVTASNAVLCAEAKTGERDFSMGGTPYALSFRGCIVTGSFLLQPTLRAIGGVTLNGARISGDVWMQGAHVCAEWGDALTADGTHIGGSVALSALFRSAPTEGQLPPGEPFRSEGCVRLYGAKIDGELYMAGAHLNARKDGEWALLGFLAKIGTKLRCVTAHEDGRAAIPFQSRGRIDLQGAEIGGGLDIHDAQLDGVENSSDGVRLNLDSSRIHGDLSISQVTARGGDLSLLHCTIDGGLTIQGTDATPIELGAVLAAGASVGQDFQVSNVKIRNQLLLQDCRVGIDLVLQRMELLAAGDSLRALGIKVVGSLRLANSTAKGSIVANSAQIGQDALFFRVRCSTLRLSDSRIGIDLIFQGVELTKSIGVALDASAIKAGGSLIFREIAQENLPPIPTSSAGWISVKDGEIGRRLEISSLTLRGTQVHAPVLDIEGAELRAGLHIKKFECKPPADAERLRRMRKRPLNAFYPGWELVESLYQGVNDEGGIASLLWNNSTHEVIALNGTSPPIHGLNARMQSPLSAMNAEAAAEYLQFFCAHVWGEDGAFRILTREDELNARLEAAEKKSNNARQDCEPRLQLKPQKHQRGYLIETVVSYAGSIFLSDFVVERTGHVEMISDKEIAGPYRRQRRYEPPIRYNAAPLDFATFDAALHLDSTPGWPVPPIFPGVWNDWNESDENQRTAILRAISALRRSAWKGAENRHADIIDKTTISRIRWTPLACYPGWALIQGLAHGPSGQSALSWLWDGSDGALLLDGTSPPIHGFNEHHRPNLADEDAIKAYARFFCTHVWGEEGPFLLVEHADELPVAAADRVRLAGLLAPITVQREVSNGSKGGLFVNATIAYAGHLFRAKFQIHVGDTEGQPAGAMVMLQDEPIDGSEHTLTLAFEPPFVRPAKKVANPAPRSAAKDDPLQWPIPVAFGDGWAPVSDAAMAAILPGYSSWPKDARPFCINLRGAKTREVQDDMGLAIPEQVRLNLSGFTFDQIDVGGLEEPNQFFGPSATSQSSAGGDTPQPRNARGRSKTRLEWLRRTSSNNEALTGLFDSHPYEQVIKAYRDSGRTEDALGILEKKLDKEYSHLRDQYLASWRQPFTGWRGCVTVAALAAGGAAAAGALPLTALFWTALIWVVIAIGPPVGIWGFKAGFMYGLSVHRALVVFAVCLLGGWVLTEVANRGTLQTAEIPHLVPAITIADFSSFPQVLMVDQTPVQTSVVQTDDPKTPLETTAVLAERRSLLGTATPTAPSEIPCGREINEFLYAADVFLPLIDLRQESKCEPTTQEWAGLWRVGKAFYALLGWIVTSLTILTVTGILRRSER